MQLRIVILPDGRLGLYSEDGSFAEGEQTIAAVLATLGAVGIELAEVGRVEQHRHDDQLVREEVHHEH
jgi:hypothetical protein